MQLLNPIQSTKFRLAAAICAAFLLAGCPVPTDAPPQAGFRADRLSGPAPLAVQFTDVSIAGGAIIDSWFWEFGDGATSTQQDPAHTFQANGVYSVSLTVSSAFGSDSSTRENYISVGAATEDPVADFLTSPTSGPAPLEVQFTDSSSGNGLPINSWSWNFGDGTTSSLQNPTHTYFNEGLYTVSLTVETAAGSDTRTRSQWISVIAEGVLPLADFTAAPRSGNAPLEVAFTDASSPGSSSITKWEWNFGDGGVSNQRNPVHTFTAAGDYSVRLRVTTAQGDDEELKLNYITVGTAEPPVAQFSASVRSGSAPLEVIFTNTSDSHGASITSNSWDFGDGAFSTQQNPTHTYLDAGTYTVSLEFVTTDGTDTETKTDYITVTDDSQAEYDAGFDDGYLEDAEYWQGYDDSWDTRDGGDIYYTGSDIPYYNEISYRAGYWDGVWYAYNDGYFVAYDYAFTIGFSEGYDLAYYPDYLDFLAGDEHVEWLDGGFTDGYNDGFSEGRILGAADYRDGIAYDWLDAMLWYREGNDAYIEELDLGTGAYGPVLLYEYGTDPNDLFKKTTRPARPNVVAPMSIRSSARAAGKAEVPDISYRTLPGAVEADLDVQPSTTPRSERILDLASTWLERIEAYRNAAATKAGARTARTSKTR